MLRAHPLSRLIPLLLRSFQIPHNRCNTTATAKGRLKDTPMSPAAIVSAVHQHIVFGARPWNVPDVKPKDTPLRKEDKTRVHGYVQPLGGKSTSVGLPLKRPPRIPTSTTADLEALADDLEAHAATSADALPRIYRKQSLRARLLVVLATTQDAASAWAAYRALLVLPRSSQKARPKVPFAHRHRLLRLLAAAPRPRPRGRFAQVLSVLRALQDAGGTVQRWQWNFLLDCVGKEGWRRLREEHFRAALGLLAQMKHPQQRHSTDNDDDDDGDVGSGSGSGVGARALEPDIYSYSTLIAHAVRTGAPAAVRHAMQLLARAGHSPGVHAHTALLCFFARQGDLAGVRDTLFRMRQAREGGLEQVPFNAVLWAFAYNDRLDVARAMYRVVCTRHASEQVVVEEEGVGQREEEEEEEEEVKELEVALAEREMVFIARDVVPDAATYLVLIQACAYHGDLRGSLEMLSDMLSAPTATTAASRLTAFRAIFLGFARHGVNAPSPSPSSHPAQSEWTLPTLEALFVRFLELEMSRDLRLRENTLFWLVSAFVRTSGHDADVLRRVIERVEERFGYVWPSSSRARLARIREKFIS